MHERLQCNINPRSEAWCSERRSQTFQLEPGIALVVERAFEESVPHQRLCEPGKTETNVLLAGVGILPGCSHLPGNGQQHRRTADEVRVLHRDSGPTLDRLLPRREERHHE